MSQPNGGGPPNDPYAGLYRRDPNETQGTPPPLGGYQQPVSAPEDEAEGDRYGWLYRPENAESAVPPAPPRYRQLTPQPDPQPSPRPTPQPSPAPVPPPPPPQPAQQWEQDEQRGPSRWPIVVTVLVVVALMGVIAGVGVPLFLERTGSDQNAGEQKGGDPGGKSDGGSPYDGDVSAVTPASAATDCQAPPATDDAGNPVKYGPKLMFDGDKATAWRCDGAAEGERVTFTLPPGTSLGEVGLINGYTKVDPKTEADRYGEYRRITKVTWTLPDGSKHQQELADDEHKMQTLRVPAVEAGEVVLTIDAVTDPGQPEEPTRDAVLIPEVRFGATS